MPRFVSILFLALLACRSGTSGSSSGEVAEPQVVVLGLAAMEVRHHEAVIWVQTDRATTVNIEITTPTESTPRQMQLTTKASADFSGNVVVDKLLHGTAYEVEVSAKGKSEPLRGGFKTAPRTKSTVRFAFGGDLAGQNVCRDAVRGFPIAKHILNTKPDFFVALGDMIYADGVCKAVGAFGNAQVPGDFGLAVDRSSFWAHWRYNRADPAFGELLRRVSSYAVWDDHEVLNDFGPSHDTREQPPYVAGKPMTPIGRQAFLTYNPISPGKGSPKEAKLYRQFRWGDKLDVFILDTRSYRSSNRSLDSAEKPKTMLGVQQLRTLKSWLANGSKGWKVIVSSVPVSIPTGADPPNVARDGWADHGSGQGFERELAGILGVAARANAHLIFITTDVHFASVFRYQPVIEGKPFVFHEIVVGPMSAGLYPTREFDSTFVPTRLFFHGPEATDGLSFEQALAFMSFGLIEVSDAGALGFQIVDGNGKSIFSHTLSPPTTNGMEATP